MQFFDGLAPGYKTAAGIIGLVGYLGLCELQKQEADPAVVTGFLGWIALGWKSGLSRVMKSEK